MTLRPYRPSDWPSLWPMLDATFAKGDTYAYPLDAGEDEIRRLWIDVPEATFVAVDAAGQVLGSYYLKPNHAGNGSHVCNCGYVVAEAARGMGVATRMCEHSQATAVARGYLAMQFNLVVSANDVAVRLWQKLGYAIVGTLPRAFRHPQAGLVDGYVMYKWLADRT